MNQPHTPIETETTTIPQSTISTQPQQTLAQKASAKARSITTSKPMIQKNDILSRAKFLASELTIELNSKLISKSLLKADARKIIQPLIDLCD